MGCVRSVRSDHENLTNRVLSEEHFVDIAVS